MVTDAGSLLCFLRGRTGLGAVCFQFSSPSPTRPNQTCTTLALSPGRHRLNQECGGACANTQGAGGHSRTLCPEQSWALTPTAGPCTSGLQSGCGRSLLRPSGKSSLTCPMGEGWQMPFPAALVTLRPEDCSHWSEVHSCGPCS